METKVCNKIGTCVLKKEASILLQAGVDEELTEEPNKKPGKHVEYLKLAYTGCYEVRTTQRVQGCAKLIDFDGIFDFDCEIFRNFRF